MIQTLKQAKEYMIDRIQKMTGEIVNETEEAIISTLFEERFYDKIGTLVSEEEIASLQAKNGEDFEGKLFYKIPNYVTILQETTAEFLANYLSPSVDELGELTDNTGEE